MYFIAADFIFLRGRFLSMKSSVTGFQKFMRQPFTYKENILSKYEKEIYQGYYRREF